MKWIFGDFTLSKSSVSVNFEFLRIFHLQMWIVFKKSKFIVLEIVKLAVLKFWFHVIFEQQKNLAISKVNWQDVKIFVQFCDNWYYLIFVSKLRNLVGIFFFVRLGVIDKGLVLLPNKNLHLSLSSVQYVKPQYTATYKLWVECWRSISNSVKDSLKKIVKANSKNIMCHSQ